MGVVWPGDTVFPDFTSLNANLWWAKHLEVLQDEIHFDGVWIDMNEPSNFVHGSKVGKIEFVVSSVWVVSRDHRCTGDFFPCFETE